MNIKNLLLASSIAAMNTSCSQGNPPRDINSHIISTQTEQTIGKPHSSEGIISLQDANNISDKEDSKNANTKDQIFICLKKDGENSFTYTNTLESIDDPDSPILEFPISHLFQKYGNRTHPLTMRGVARTYGALLGQDGIETQFSSIPQKKLINRPDKITSSTKYEVGDTLRFKLINPQLEGKFPENLSDQLKESGFEGFVNYENQGKYAYDIVVKKLSDGRSALALYKNGKLFMSSYASVGLNKTKTKVGQFKILGKFPYYISKKYKSPMPNGLKFDEGGYFFHQGNVTGYPASHGCVRLPGIYALCLYSLVKNSEHTDVFIDKNLYSE